ncbi:hypothetical protein ACFWP5_32535 [Streptomyces sp. NPDC058469]|uniref:hypothetical protein n=1 Tax=Streptomyces sp. NPDC058469 TaxID=3346514 RepID=UPI00365CD633
MSELDNARAALQPFMFVVGFIDAIERFEAAVRANERSGETRAAVLRETADRLATDAEQGQKEGFTRIYQRAAATKVRGWADETGPRTVAELSRCTCDYIAEPWISMDHAPDCPVRPSETQP